jgi:hypothetical protein
MDWPWFRVPVGGVVFRGHRLEPLGVVVLDDAPEELDGLLPFRLRFTPRHHLGHSVLMVRRECGNGPGIVASEELVPESLSTIPGRDSGFRFAAAFFGNTDLPESGSGIELESARVLALRGQK